MTDAVYLTVRTFDTALDHTTAAYMTLFDVTDLQVPNGEQVLHFDYPK